MKIIITLSVLIFSVVFASCKKEQLSSNTRNCMQTPPAFCATVRCTPDGKPVCGCNNVTYGSVCEAQCAGVTSYTAGPCP